MKVSINIIKSVRIRSGFNRVRTKNRCTYMRVSTHKKTLLEREEVCILQMLLSI